MCTSSSASRKYLVVYSTVLIPDDALNVLEVLTLYGGSGVLDRDGDKNEASRRRVVFRSLGWLFVVVGAAREQFEEVGQVGCSSNTSWKETSSSDVVGTPGLIGDNSPPAVVPDDRNNLTLSKSLNERALGLVELTVAYGARNPSSLLVQ